MSKKQISICWLRRDLRLNDNTALYHALRSPDPVLPIFIFDPEILDKLTDKRDKRVSFIYETISQLNIQLEEHKSSIYVLNLSVINAFEKIFGEFDVKAIYVNEDYEPYAICRDLLIKKMANDHGVEFKSFKDQVLFEKSDILKADRSPYTIFTPYSKRWRQLFDQSTIEDFPSEKYLSCLLKSSSPKIPTLKEIGFEPVDTELRPLNLNSDLLMAYHETRNIPAVNGTSNASPYLRFGTVSIRVLVKLAMQSNETWLNELIWREFFMMILYHFPHVVDHSFKAKYDRIPWRNNEKEFDLWCKGETGYPIVDAGMRQLNETGWMHNRVRMIVAGFLTKHLLIDWRWGEAYFAQKLLDYELSSNNGNWQWAAGSGCDSAPYFRVFNPTTQTQKFDPKLIYIKTWITDFNTYHLVPIVEHDYARKRALEVYKKALNEV